MNDFFFRFSAYQTNITKQIREKNDIKDIHRRWANKVAHFSRNPKGWFGGCGFFDFYTKCMFKCCYQRAKSCFDLLRFFFLLLGIRTMRTERSSSKSGHRYLEMLQNTALIRGRSNETVSRRSTSHWYGQ